MRAGCDRPRTREGIELRVDQPIPRAAAAGQSSAAFMAELDPAHLADKRRDSLEAKVAGNTDTHLYTSSFSPPNHVTTLVCLSREQNVAEMRSLVDRLIGVYLDFADQNLSTDAVAARKVVSDDLLVLLADFPAHRPRYDAIRARLFVAP